MSLRYVDPMNETPAGKLLGIVRQLEDVVKSKYANMNCSVCNSVCNSEGECPTCGKVEKGSIAKEDEVNVSVGSETVEVSAMIDGQRKRKRYSGHSKEEAERMFREEYGLSKSVSKPDFLDMDGDGNKKESMKDAIKDKNGKKGYKSDRGQKDTPKLPSPKGKKTFGKEDATSAFLRERGIIVKYEQEKTVENGVPQFLEQPSGIRATVYSTNHRIPAMNDGPSKSIVSEVAKMPSVAQTGYDTSASSLHMHLNYAGGVTDNLDSAEDALASLRKAYPGSLGIIEEIASLTEQVYARL